MPDIITLTGLVATQPRVLTTGEGLAITSFRLASTQRRFDRAKQKWVDGDTNWYTITAFRQLAANAGVSVKKGERVLVTGRLHFREWESGERKGTTMEVEADALGHDLSWGTASFSRSIAAASVEPADFPTEAELGATATDPAASASSGGEPAAGAPEPSLVASGAAMEVPF
ncbi:MAG: single-stranded DNA-binding protein [Glaciihabitans sp.]|nr:single-stranded DNA-binding protein [Glaciihabitans sp.]